MLQCYHIHRSASKKNSNENMLLDFRQVFLLIFFVHISFSNKQYLYSVESGKSSCRNFWFHAEEMNENWNHNCLPMEVPQELCSLLPLLQLRNPTERKSDEISRGSRWFKALKSLKPCQGYQVKEHLEPGNSPAKER